MTERRSKLRWLVAGGALLVLAGLGAGTVWEMRASPLQARYFSERAAGLTWEVEAGASDRIRFPGSGPYDVRHGYHTLPVVLTELGERGFVVDAQARMSDDFLAWMDGGRFPIYPEKSQSGVRLYDAEGEALYGYRYPERIYPDFYAIPDLVWQTLLFVENRTLLDERYPTRNPAVEWPRLFRAVFDAGLRALGSDRSVPGASTLATQIEKFRHAPEGRTESPRDKLLQMESASMRAYRDGPETLPSRRRIVQDYLNSVPFAGISGLGEVSGLGDGLWAWFGADFESVNDLLRAVATGERDASSPEAAAAYRQVLMLILAVQRPSFFLGRPEGWEALEARTRRFAGLLAQEGVITPEFRDAVLAAKVEVRSSAPPRTGPTFVERKAPDAARTQLLALTGTQSLYALDRMDLAARTTFHKVVQDSILSLLRNLSDPEYVRAQGLNAFRLLERGDPARVQYAFVLHEISSGGNLVRVQADNVDGPFQLTAGGKLELGSTAKLRTLVTYLEVVEALYREHAGSDASALRAVEVGRDDRITAWALTWLQQNPEATLEQMLRAAMERPYSANPAERFFTGGGVHTFVNFDRTHDARVLPLSEAFRHSVNLPFIRVMRDVTYYHIHRLPGYPAQILSDRQDPRRQEYLTRFADQEGQVFLGQFYRKHQGLDPDASLEAMLAGRTLTPQRLAWTFRAVLPEADLAAFSTFMRQHTEQDALSEARLAELYRRSDPAPHPLVDQGYLAGVHPLEIWLARYLREYPAATRAEVMAASRDVRQDVYGWLFATRRTAAQDQRIRSILEAEAFQEIHRSWRRVGYPFDALVPSYATAIGSSADRPDALAELVGVVLADGVRYPTRTVTEVQLAVGTPYETRLSRRPARGERVLSTELSRVVRDAMADVVDEGTAVRARNSVRLPDGTPVVIGGKTGTGNNRYRVYGPGGRLVQDRAINRTSTLVFFLGDRFYGSITAYVPGAEADDYGFTSSLPSQILRMAGPLLASLLTEDEI